MLIPERGDAAPGGAVPVDGLPDSAPGGAVAASGAAVADALSLMADQQSCPRSQ